MRNETEEPRRRALRPSYFRYFHRGQNEKPSSQNDYLIMKPKKVKLTGHYKLLKKFRHKEALVAALNEKNPENVGAVMEELVARKKLLACVINLQAEEELGMLLRFLQKYSTRPRYAAFCMGLARKGVETRSEDIRSSEALRGHLMRDIGEEMRIQKSMQYKAVFVLYPELLPEDESFAHPTMHLSLTLTFHFILVADGDICLVILLFPVSGLV